MAQRSIAQTVPKFVLVGILNTLFGTCAMFLLYNLVGVSYWGSTMTAYVFGGIISFLLNKYFTFQSKTWAWRQVYKFAANLAVCYVIAYGLAKPLTSALLSGQTVHIQENFAILVGEVIYTILNYFGQHFVVFQSAGTKPNA